MIQTFRDLEVYKRSFEASVEMYQLTKSYPRDELYGLISQIKRAATSIPLNVAEGYGKKENVDDFKRFLLMVIGSCNEMRVLMDLSARLGFITKEVHIKYEREYDEIGKMLTSLRQRWKQRESL